MSSASTIRAFSTSFTAESGSLPGNPLTKRTRKNIHPIGCLPNCSRDGILRYDQGDTLIPLQNVHAPNHTAPHFANPLPHRPLPHRISIKRPDLPTDHTPTSSPVSSRIFAFPYPFGISRYSRTLLQTSPACPPRTNAGERFHTCTLPSETKTATITVAALYRLYVSRACLAQKKWLEFLPAIFL